MQQPFFREKTMSSITDGQRALLGFVLGIAMMSVIVRVSVVNTVDFNIMQRGAFDLLNGMNPWRSVEDFYGFYNPPYSVLFLWPLIFITPQMLQVFGGALLVAIVFYQKTPVAIAWFFTNSILWVIAMGGIDMYLMGAGLLLLFAGDKYYNRKWGILLRVLAFGFLMLKPQGGFFIILLFVLSRKDWKAPLISAVIYGLPFIMLYPSWIQTSLAVSPITDVSIEHSILGVFGKVVAGVIAVLIIVARKWDYWQLGGALAAILVPYGLPAVPVFLTLSAVRSLKAIPVVIIFSGCLAALTWLQAPPPEIVDFNAYVKPYLDIYNLSMVGLPLALACVSETDYAARVRVIAVGEWAKKGLLAGYKKFVPK